MLLPPLAGDPGEPPAAAVHSPETNHSQTKLFRMPTGCSSCGQKGITKLLMRLVGLEEAAA